MLYAITPEAHPMSFPARIGLVLFLLYMAFFSWYTSFGGPLSESEIAYYGEVVEALTDGDPARMAVWMEFMQNDTGDDFVMLNAIDMRDTPQQVPGVEPGETSAEVLARYTEPFLGKALLSAAHPVMLGWAAAPAIDLWGIEGAEHWDQGGLVRYRSRRDLLEQAVGLRESTDQSIHAFKIAAMEKTIAYPLDPWYQLGDPRFVLALVFAVIGLSVKAFSTSKQAA